MSYHTMGCLFFIGFVIFVIIACFIAETIAILFHRAMPILPFIMTNEFFQIVLTR